MGLIEKVIPKKLLMMKLEYDVNQCTRYYEYHQGMANGFAASKEEAEFKLERLRRYTN